jgi:hypothetical protein
MNADVVELENARKLSEPKFFPEFNQNAGAKRVGNARQTKTAQGLRRGLKIGKSFSRE